MSNQPFVQNLIARCQQRPGTVILPEATDPRTLDAVEILSKERVCSKIVLIVPPHAAREIKSADFLSASKNMAIEIRNSNDEALRQNVADYYVKLQHSKGRTQPSDQIAKVSSDPLFQAGWLLTQEPNSCAVAGAVATTADVIRAALNTVGLASGVRTVSGGFFMERSTGTQRQSFYYADAGVVVEPSVDQLVDIAAASCDTWSKIMSSSPVVAFLSFSTKGSAVHPLASKMIDATKKFQASFPDIESDGELQFDTAAIASVGERKAPQSKIPGRANIFIFPDLNSGNIAYKITQRLGGFEAYGPILQGLACPYSDLSRGATASDIAVSAMINLLRR